MVHTGHCSEKFIAGMARSYAFSWFQGVQEGHEVLSFPSQ
jgi:hypothetical protein